MLSRSSMGLSPQTVRWYEGILRAFARQFSRLPTSPSDIESFINNCKAGDERKHGYYRTLRCFYRFLSQRYKIHNPTELVNPPRRKQKQTRFLLPDEIAKLLSFPHAPDIKAALLFLVDTGARPGELSSLDIEQLKDTPWGYIAIVRGKVGERIVPINYETYHALMVNLPFKYTNHRLRRKISQAFKDAGVKGSALTLRHTFGTLWEGDELVLQSIIGHANLSTTKGYRQLRTKIISRQHRQYSPLNMVFNTSRSML